MPKKARSPEEISLVKESILANALTIMSEGGYSSLTMRDLARKCGMTATNLYNYYSSKDEIYLVLVIKGFEILYNSMTTAAATISDPLGKARAMILAYYAFGRDQGHYYDIMFTLPTPKYEDYVSTTLESTARIELELSKKIERVAFEALKLIASRSVELSEEEATYRLMEIWSSLHGLITLSRSKIIFYLAKDPDAIFERVMDEYLKGRYWD